MIRRAVTNGSTHHVTDQRPAVGRIMFGYPTSSLGSLPSPAASAAPRCGQHFGRPRMGTG